MAERRLFRAGHRSQGPDVQRQPPNADGSIPVRKRPNRTCEAAAGAIAGPWVMVYGGGGFSHGPLNQNPHWIYADSPASYRPG